MDALRRIEIDLIGGRATVRGLDGADMLAVEEAACDPAAALAVRLADAVSGGGAADRPWSDVERILLGALAATLGPRLELVAECRCGARAEIALRPAAILTAPPPEATCEGQADGLPVRLRTPTGAEMRRAAMAAPEAGAAILAAAIRVAADDTSDAALDRAAEEANAAGLLLVDAACPECGAPLTLRLDPLALIRQEAARSGDVLGETSRLSAAWGLSPREVLALPHLRRRRMTRLLAGVET